MRICREREREREREKSSDRSPLHHTLCSLASYTHALIIFFFFFFFWALLYNHNNVFYCIWVSHSTCMCFCFWWVCLCVGFGLLYPIGFGLFKAQKLWMDFEVIHGSTWAWASQITHVSILEFKLGKKQLKKTLKII